MPNGCSSESPAARFRRQVTAADVVPYLELFNAERQKSSFEEAQEP